MEMWKWKIMIKDLEISKVDEHDDKVIYNVFLKNKRIATIIIEKSYETEFKKLISFLNAFKQI